MDQDAPYEEKIRFYFSDYEKAAAVGKELGIKVFCGVELSYKGTDFLVYGLDKEWYLQNPQIMEIPIKEMLAFMRACGGYVAQAHPYREAGYIDHIRLYPRSVDAVEVINANRTSLENEMSGIYAEQYGLQAMAGSDNHVGAGQKALAGIASPVPLCCVADFIDGMRQNAFELFYEK